MINNPCSWYVDGSNKVSFTYEGGSTLYHFGPRKEIDDLLKGWCPINIIFFANNKEHATDVIDRMLRFRIEALAAYEKERGTDYSVGTETRNLPRLLLDNKDKWIITEAPIDQFYEVGWSSNDKIL